jgi:hypothetical protein
MDHGMEGGEKDMPQVNSCGILSDNYYNIMIQNIISNE